MSKPIFTVALITAAAALHHPVPCKPLTGCNSSREVRQLLTNHNDLIFTGSVVVSGEKVETVMDSGSFELVLFGIGCEGCVESSTFFNPSKAAGDYRETNKVNIQGYGSGFVSSAAGFATVEIRDVAAIEGGSLQANSQLFWLADKVEMDVDVDGTFSGIFGLGPPGSAIALARQRFAAFEGIAPRSSGAKVERDMAQGVLNLEEESRPFLQLAGIGVFSICLLSHAGSDGYIIFNDEATDHINHWIPTSGIMFWEVRISQVHIETTKFAKDGCSAIVDSGTSLIGVPSALYTEIIDLVSDLVDKNGCCDDLSSWPDFKFELGGQQLNLPPSSYVALYDWERWDDDLANDAVPRGDGAAYFNAHRHFMPHLHRSSATRSSTFNCEPAVFTMDSVGGGITSECQFLLGLPIFRQYYVSHKLDTNTGAAGKMAFSVPEPSCTGPRIGDDFAVHTDAFNPITVKPEKIRFPDFAFRPQAQKIETRN